MTQAHYHITQAVWLPDDGEVFSYISPITPFQKMDLGEPIAKGNRGTIIKSPASGYALMAPATEPLPTKEEFFFLAEKRS